MQQDRQWKLVQVRSTIEALLIFLSIILMQIAGYLLCTGICLLLHFQPDKSTFVMMISMASSVLSFLWCSHLYRKSTWRDPSFSYRNAFSGRSVFSWLAVGAGGCIFLKVLLTLLSMIFPEMFQEYQQTMGQFSSGDLRITLFYVLLIGPVSEEMIFRGAMMDRCYLAYPFWLANILQAALFGIYHMNLIQGMYAFGLGLALGFIRRSAGTIWSTILAHITFNVTNYLLEFLFSSEGKTGWIKLSVTFVFGIILFAVGLWYNKRQSAD